jgi:hypothetical protein
MTVRMENILVFYEDVNISLRGTNTPAEFFEAEVLFRF